MNSLSAYAKANGGTFTVLKQPSKIRGTNKTDANPSVVFYNGKYYINQRIINYNLVYSAPRFELFTDSVDQVIQLNQDEGSYVTENIITDTETGAQYEIEFPKHVESEFVGFEDAKFVTWDGRLYMYGTRLDVYYGQGNICIYLINTDNFTIEKEWVIKNFPLYGLESLEVPNWVIQKNWMAIPDRPFHFMYSPSPTVIIRVDPDDCSYSMVMPPSENGLGHDVRGSAPLCRIDDDTYLALVHTNNGGFDENGRHVRKYKFKAILYDNNFIIKKESDWFVFMNDKTEFCCGMCVNNGRITFTHCSFDSSSYITELELWKFLAFVDGERVKRNFFDERYLYDTAVSMENDGLNAISWFNHIACTAKQTELIHYESAVRVLAFWSFNKVVINTCLENMRLLSFKYTKLFPDRCEAFYLLSTFEALSGNLEKASELKTKADSVRDGDRSVIDRYLQPHYM